MKCTFCNNEIPKGSGTMYVKVSGQVLYFCSSKCEKNMLKLSRVGREQKWTNVQKQPKEKTEKKKE